MAIYRQSTKTAVKDAETVKFLSSLFSALDAKKKQIMQANRRSFVLRDHVLARVDSYELRANYVLDMIDIVDSNNKLIDSFFRLN